ncbi:MAG: 3-dehydroquinate synthase [Pseudomonadota bacterium]
MTDLVSVALGLRSYDIHIGGGLLSEAGPMIAELHRSPSPGTNLPVIVDANVTARHLPIVQTSLIDAGFEPLIVEVPSGEASKSFDRLAEVLDAILAAGIERSSMLVALGGGVVGDLAGFAAAVALRGIDFIQIPTTLLSQVDSSVGGKTGINSPQGKNLIGAFHQPRLVLADLDTLETLPRRELLAGYAEVVKYGAIQRPEFFDWLEDNGQKALDGDREAMAHAIRISCETKAEVVAADETEAGRRGLLNLGHTFGHALEAELGYSGHLLHGEAVAVGMVLAFDLSVRLGLCPPNDAARLRNHLATVGLPTTLPDHPNEGWLVDRLLSHMAKDKKVVSGQLTLVLARGIGKAFLTRQTDPADLREHLERAVAA